MVHPVSVTYSGVQISLKNAFSDEAYSGVSDSSGDFIFGPVDPGIYLLTIVGGSKYLYGRASETTMVLDITPSSQRDWLKLKLQDTGCYSVEFQLDEHN
jgi:hypothetical protein